MTVFFRDVAHFVCQKIKDLYSKTPTLQVTQHHQIKHCQNVESVKRFLNADCISAINHINKTCQTPLLLQLDSIDGFLRLVSSESTTFALALIFVEKGQNISILNDIEILDSQA